MPKICGFCDVRDEKHCTLCEVKDMRELLQALVDKDTWEHNIKYRADDEEEVRNCAHCKHVLIDYDTRYHAAANYGTIVWCTLDCPDNMDEQGCYPSRNSQDSCPKWERAVAISSV